MAKILLGLFPAGGQEKNFTAENAETAEIIIAKGKRPKIIPIIYDLCALCVLRG
jgi:hypothetical protein